MPLFTVDEKVLNRHYIEEKFELSKSFAIALANFLLLSIPTYTFLTYFAKELVAKNNLVLAVYAVLSLIIKKITFPPKVTHMLAILLVCLVQARVIYVGLWIHPEFTSAYAVAGFLFLWHYHLEFTYDVMQGYGTIVAHLVIWCFCAVKSGQIKDFPPGDVFFLLGIVSYLQFRRYSYQVSNDRELIKRKLNLNAKQTNIQNLLNSVPEGVAVLNVNYQILMKNDSFEKLTQGYTLSDMKINQKFSVNKQNTFENLLQCIQEFQNSQEVTTTFGVCVCQRFYLECTGSKTEWNEHSALVLTFREVSNVIQLENEVNLNSKTLKILQGVSHELKTPLNQIINEHQDVLHRCEDISESLRMHLKKALSSSNYLLSLVKDMIDYSHIKFNNLGLDFSWIRIDEVISECILMVKEINSSCSISFQHDLAQSITVFTDQNRFKQSFLNLIFFSLGHIIHGSIKICLRKSNDKVLISISFDSQMNYLMPTKATLEYSHESLRLKISKKMIGRICAEELKITIEENDFITLSLVFDSTDNVSTDSMPEVPDEGGITSKSSNFLVNPTVKITFIDILIVDDIEFNISVLENLLGNLKHKCTCENTHRKFKVHSANSGKQAIDMVRKLNAQKGGYKLIIMDCLMPEMSGWEATIEIIKMFKENQIKVLPHILAYSAFDSRLDISTSLNSGMCGHISKPCMPKDLCKSINFWLNTPLSINFSHN